MLISFLFVSNKLISDKLYFKNRLLKLVFPLIVWALIYYVIYFISDILNITNINASLIDLLYQMIFGHSGLLNATMWFQFDLIIWTIFFYLLYKYINKDNANKITLILIFIALLAQYTRANAHLFYWMNYSISNPLGRLLETYPYAAIGLLLSQKDYFKLIYSNKVLIFICSIIACVLIKFINLPVPVGFGYTGINNIIIAISVVNVFSLLPINENKILLLVTKYTFGVYCMHRLINTYLSILVGNNAFNGSLSYCVVVYLICYAISSILSKNNKLKLLVE